MPTARISPLTPDGRRLAVAGTRQVLLHEGMPGDEVRYAVVPGRGRTPRGELEEVLNPSADRRTPPCPFSANCGGCDLDALTEEAQREARTELVARATERSWDQRPMLFPVAPFSAYRARITLHLDGGQVGYRAPRSHDLVPVDVCRIARPEIQDAHRKLVDFIARHGHEGLSDVELRSDGARVIYAFVSDGSVPRALREALGELGDVALDGRTHTGDPTLTLDVLGLSLRASPRAFYQVHLEANLALVGLVVAAVQEARPQRIVDLYAGIGNLTLPLARDGGAPVVAVEREGQATEDLRHNAEQAGLTDQVSVVTRPVERWDPSREPFDVVVLDPPRIGAKGVVDKLVLQRPRRIVYVACHVSSALRDLQPALAQGYFVRRVQLVDLFPDTHHVETVLVVDRGDQR